MTTPHARAQQLVRRASDGLLGQDGRDLVALLAAAHQQGRADQTRARLAEDRAAALEREANALAAIVADLLDGKRIDEVADDLPHDARRRVIAYRHQGTRLFRPFTPLDQFGPLPKVPPRAAVMRDRVRVVDADDERTNGSGA